MTQRTEVVEEETELGIFRQPDKATILCSGQRHYAPWGRELAIRIWSGKGKTCGKKTED